MINLENRYNKYYYLNLALKEIEKDNKKVVSKPNEEIHKVLEELSREGFPLKPQKLESKFNFAQ